MAIAGALREGRTLSCAQHHLTVVLDELQFALKHVDKFVLVAVPVALARPTTRRQGHEIDAEVPEPARIAQSTTRTSGARGIERRWIARTLTCWNGGYVNLRHSLLTLCASTKEATYGKCVPAA